MGCCAVKRERLDNENLNVFSDVYRKTTANNESLNIGTFSDKNVVSMEYARGFFKTKVGMKETEEGIKITSSGNTKDLNSSKQREKEEFQEKKNNEEEQKEGISYSIKDKELINYPRLEIVLVNSRLNSSATDKIIITPNSINGVIKKIGEKFSFGRSSSQMAPNSLLGSLTTFGGKSNDYNFTDESIGQKQFEICYSKEKGKFFIVDNKRGTGLFVKVKQHVTINHDMIVSFCASHMILQVEPEVYHPENKIIRIRFLQGPHQNQEKVFNSKDKKIIRIGRSKHAEVVYKDDSVSRIQCTLVFENNEWCLYDGYPENGNKGSTNGLWLLASNKLEMTNDMILKTGNTTMLVKLIENENDVASGSLL